MTTNKRHIASNSLMTLDYSGSHIYRNGALERIENGYGYWADSCYHYRIADYQGNVRAVISQDGALEEVNGYYPYGGITGAPATGVQARKYGGKELDRENGLDWYDFEARMYDPMLPQFKSIDRKAEDYPSTSPFAYCAGNPILYIDPTGKDWIVAYYNDTDLFFFYDSKIHNQDDVYNKYGKDTNIKYLSNNLDITYKSKHGEENFKLLSNGNILKNKKALIDEYDSGTGLHIGSDKFTDISSINDNWYGSYLGPDNPKKYYKNKDSYAVPPINELDYAAYLHDKGYDKVKQTGFEGITSKATKQADYDLAKRAFKAATHATKFSQAIWGYTTGIVFYIIQGLK